MHRRAQPDRLSAADRRNLLAELFARRLMELAAKGLLPPVEDEPDPADVTGERSMVEEVADGPR